MLPNLLISRLKTILGSYYDEVMHSFAKTRKGSFRINFLKSDGDIVLKEFQEKWIVVEMYPKILWAYTFDREYEYAIKGTRAFYEGNIYVQSIASQMPALVLDPQ